jgi:predicted HTH transcriptional regulator
VIPLNSEVLKHFGTINGTIKNELSEEKNSLVNYLIRNPKVTNNNCSSDMKISRRSIARLFNTLQNKGIVIREGSKKSGKWKIVK